MNSNAIRLAPIEGRVAPRRKAYPRQSIYSGAVESIGGFTSSYVPKWAAGLSFVQGLRSAHIGVGRYHPYGQYYNTSFAYPGHRGYYGYYGGYTRVGIYGRDRHVHRRYRAHCTNGYWDPLNQYSYFYRNYYGPLWKNWSYGNPQCREYATLASPYNAFATRYGGYCSPYVTYCVSYGSHSRYRHGTSCVSYRSPGYYSSSLTNCYPTAYVGYGYTWPRYFSHSRYRSFPSYSGTIAYVDTDSTYVRGENAYVDTDRTYVEMHDSYVNDEPVFESNSPFAESDSNVIPIRINSYVELGNSAFFDGRYDEARRYYVRGVLADENDSVAVAMYGFASFATGKYEIAARAMRRAVSMDASLIDAPIDYTSVYASYDSFEAHLLALEDFIRGKEHEKELLFLFGYILYSIEEPERALPIMEHLSDINANDVHAMLIRDAASLVTRVEPQDQP